MKKQICLVMAAMMAAGMLAGCSGSAKETTAAATEAATTAEETKAEETTAEETTAAASGEETASIYNTKACGRPLMSLPIFYVKIRKTGLRRMICQNA